MEFKTPGMPPRWLLLAAFAVMVACAAAPSAHASPAMPDSTFIAAVSEGDSAFAVFDNETARLCYQRAFAIDSTDCNVLWKLARADVHRGMVVPEDDKVRWFTASEALARRCVALYPDSSEAHFFLAVSLGQMTKVVGGKHRLELSKEVKHEAEVTLSLDPKHYGAMHVLGRWNYEVAGLGWFSRAAAKIIYGGVPNGSYEQAKEWFERAIAIRPDMPLNHLWLGETLIKLHDYTGARAEFERCISLDDVLWDDPITRAHAQKMLHEIEGKK
jgi:tetratricopeptide (TPR) repeat protein